MTYEELLKENAELKKLVQAQKQYREDSERSLKDAIGKSLSIEYEDFRESLDIPMNEMLGEVYREKLIEIERILKGFDITI